MQKIKAFWINQHALLTPITAFLAIFVTYEAVNLVVTLAKINYNIVHFIFGFSAPLLFGYVPLYWVKARNRYAYYWSLNSGILITLAWCVYNETIVDPRQNGIAFFDAWENLAADILGLTCIKLLRMFALQNRKKIKEESNGYF